MTDADPFLPLARDLLADGAGYTERDGTRVVRMRTEDLVERAAARSDAYGRAWERVPRSMAGAFMASRVDLDDGPRYCCDHHGGWADAPSCEDDDPEGGAPPS